MESERTQEEMHNMISFDKYECKMCITIIVLVPTNHIELKKEEGSATSSLIYYWATH